jgi:hypothetical protein
LIRFQQGKWKTMRVIEPELTDEPALNESSTPALLKTEN